MSLECEAPLKVVENNSNCGWLPICPLASLSISSSVYFSRLSIG